MELEDLYLYRSGLPICRGEEETEGRESLLFQESQPHSKFIAMAFFPSLNSHIYLQLVIMALNPNLLGL
jgi:hypothetical protein